MSLSDHLESLLERKGYQVTDAVRQAIEDFVEAVEHERGHLVDTDDEDDVAEEDLARNQSVTCPFCGEPTDLAIDLSGGDQDDIQDCSVCCRPIRVRYSADHGRLSSFSTEPA